MTSALEVWLESALIALAVLPLGFVILRGTEWVLRHRFSLSHVERAVFALYAAGGALFLLASIPFPLYDLASVTSVLTGGAVLYIVVALRERGQSLHAAIRWVTSPLGGSLLLGTLGLLAFEITPIAAHPFPNAWDGSSTALWMNLTLRNGTLPTSLQPFASAPVVYPMATTVWMTLPVLILGWSVVQTPVWLPPLFLALTIPSAYCWGARWGARSSISGSSVGLLFAAFFGVLASWPRFYTGGSYDFAFALPLFLVAVGLLPSFVRTERASVAQLLGFGLLAGVISSLSLAAGEALLFLLLVYSILTWWRRRRAFIVWLGRFAIAVAIEVLFSLRSLVAWATNGRPGYAPPAVYGGLTPRLVQGELDPLVPWKFKMSPFPWLSLELQVLLVAGLGICVFVLLFRKKRLRSLSLSRFAVDLLTGTTAMFALTGVLLVAALPGPQAADLRSVTNLDQSSILLFVFFEAVCAFPLVVALTQLTVGSSFPTHPDPTPATSSPKHHFESRRPITKVGFSPIIGALAVLVLLIPLASGVGFTLADGPGYIQQNVGKTSNVTAGDVAAMEWMGGHLPACSSVLVAPGSAGQFLPEFSSVHLVFPMNPVPESGPYSVVVSNLTGGIYNSVTRIALKELGVTEIFVTGQTSVSYPPFVAAPLLTSPDFSMLFGSGDASILSFVPSQTLCSP
jgi:hypothetical protein